MRTLLIVTVALAGLGARAEAPRLPRSNPEDQIRFFWCARANCYSNIAAAGVNMIINRFGNVWNAKRDCYTPENVATRKRFIDLMRPDGIDYFEQLCYTNFKDSPELAEKYARVTREGLRWKRNVDVSEPEALGELCRRARSMAATFRNDPQVAGVQTSSEIRDSSRPSFTPRMREAYRAATGCAVPDEANERLPPHYLQLADFPASRVIETTYPLFRFYSWWWKTGDGWNAYQDAIGAAFASQFDRPLATFYDPVVRTPPVRGSGGHVDYVSQWTYTYPEPYNVAWVIAEEQAMARGRPGQRVGSMVQLIAYMNEIAHNRKKTVGDVPAWRTRMTKEPTIVTTPPDIVRGGLSAQFWHRIDAVGAYAWNSVWPSDDPNTWGYPCTNPDTGRVLGEVFKRVGVPLGPLLRAFPERPMEVAYLESASAAFFAGRGTWGWRDPVYSLGVMGYAARLQPGVLYEEDLAEGGVPSDVKVLVCPYCDVLTRPSCEAILAFQRRGGIVVGDKNLVPGILPDLELPEAGRVSRMDPDCGRLNQRHLLAGAAKLRADLAPFYVPPSDADNPELITFVRSQGTTDLLFVQNDRRDYGDYVGPWRVILERGLPNAGKAMLRRTAGAVYDLVDHRPVPFAVRNGVTEIPVTFENVDVNVYLVTEKPLGDLVCTVSDKTVTVRSPDGDVMVPIEVRRAGAKPFYGVVKDGVWTHAFDSAEGLSVRDLATGRVTGPDAG